MTYWFLRRFAAIPWAKFFTRTMRWSLRILPVLVMMDFGYMIGIWPNWDLYSEGPVPRSSFILDYENERHRHLGWPALHWRSIGIEKIPRNMVRALIVAEDARFYSHSGVDIDALKTAMEYNLSERRLVLGASTISQQTVKNLFLNPSRNPLRKWHELVLTIGMERALSKKRILEIYLNVAEFGRGIYGVDAAARFYWGKRASQLSARQCIELAATLPSPVNHNPATRTRTFQNRVKKIRRYF